MFNVGKYRLVKYWDADKFELLLTLEGHHAMFGVLRSATVEEKEKRLEEMFESDLDNATENRYAPKEELPEEGAVALVGKKTQETLTRIDLIIEALDIAKKNWIVLLNMRKRKPGGNVAEFQPDIRMLGLSPSHYVLRTLSNVKTNDLEQTLLFRSALPFADAQACHT
ncbi:hypothetical protein Pint_22572 [Pistacia integerrima]|uniref:Uncharacterized protein n=1 Tax=Pistacia integerrima TaxID=434235 RepID=A0ACC0YJ44_9ROSI|nr:hypothetical protein Pint_22572 [Pistacia integerrima]